MDRSGTVARRALARALATVAVAAVAAIGAVGAAALPTPGAGAHDAKQTKRYVYRIQASYVLTGEEGDPATSLRRTSEWRIDWQYPTVGVATSKGAFVTQSGYSRGTVRISVRDERRSPPCERAVEDVNAIDVSMSISTKGSRVSLQRMQTRPETPCPPSFYHDALLVTSGALTGSRANQGGVSVRSTGALDPAFLANVTAGRSAETTIELTPATASRAGVTLRAVVTLTFTRNTNAEPKPSNKPLVVTKPYIYCCSYAADVSFALTRGGDPVGTTRATCTGSLTGGARLEGRPTSSVLEFTERASAKYWRALLARWPHLARYRGKHVTLVSCGYGADSVIRASCKTLRGSAKIVVDGRPLTRSFSFVWRTPAIKFDDC